MRSKDPGSDASLMRSFGEGDPASAEVLYQRFAPRIFGLGIVMLAKDGAAQDLVQDTLVKLWRRLI